MNILAWVAQALGLVPAAVEAGKQIADAVKPPVTINANDATLWHTVTYQYAAPFCTVCQRTIPWGFADTLCSEAVKRRTQVLR